MDVKPMFINESEYDSILQKAVAVFDETRTKAAKNLCTITNMAYWNIGKLLHEQQIDRKYGKSIIKKLSIDLKQRYPQMGLSPRQLWNMKNFYVRYKNSNAKVLHSVALLPWSHNLLIINKNLDDEQTFFYANETIKKGWNRDVLLNSIKLGIHEKHKLTPTDNNFSKVLPSSQINYANEVFHNSYNLGFLGVSDNIAEQELERRLVDKIKLFLLELGKGFTYIGNQHVLEFNGKESKVDMLFFHRGLKCLVAIDLKIGEFKPEYVGKMNYYLSLLDRLERGEGENRSIGIILCAEKDHIDVEMALEDIGKPIGVADYHLIIPKDELQKLVCNEIETFQKDKILEIKQHHPPRRSG